MAITVTSYLLAVLLLGLQWFFSRKILIFCIPKIYENERYASFKKRLVANGFMLLQMAVCQILFLAIPLGLAWTAPIGIKVEEISHLLIVVGALIFLLGIISAMPFGLPPLDKRILQFMRYLYLVNFTDEQIKLMTSKKPAN